MSESTLDETVQLPQAWLRRLAALAGRPDLPAEEDIWDAERLEQHGRFLAKHGHALRESAFPDEARGNLKQQLRRNARALESAHRSIVAALQAGRAISPAAQWIVDNFHVISDHLNDIPVRLNPRAWHRLPVAGSRPGTDPPRILLIASEYLGHTLWNFRQDTLVQLLSGYQQLAPLKMQEIWALHTVLRIALIDELARIAVRLEDSIKARAAADEFADSLVHGTLAGGHAAAAATWPEGTFAAPFIVQLTHRLQGLGERGLPLLNALSQQLAGHGTTIDDYIQRQHARRSARNVAASNIITSLRALASVEWRTLFEQTSCVESLLRERDDYVVCDRRTRDRYRASIEQLAESARRPEPAVTADLLAIIPAAASSGAQDIGAWLIGARRPELESALGCAATVRQRLRRGVIRHAASLYPGGIALLTAALTVLAVHLGTGWNESSAAVLLLALLAVIPMSELAMAVLNREWLRFFPPRHLPCLELESGLSADMKTLVSAASRGQHDRGCEPPATGETGRPLSAAAAAFEPQRWNPRRHRKTVHTYSISGNSAALQPLLAAPRTWSNPMQMKIILDKLRNPS